MRAALGFDEDGRRSTFVGPSSEIVIPGSGRVEVKEDIGLSTTSRDRFLSLFVVVTTRRGEGWVGCR